MQPEEDARCFIQQAIDNVGVNSHSMSVLNNLQLNDPSSLSGGAMSILKLSAQNLWNFNQNSDNQISDIWRYLSDVSRDISTFGTILVGANHL
jgi:hypothetical protein